MKFGAGALGLTAVGALLLGGPTMTMTTMMMLTTTTTTVAAFSLCAPTSRERHGSSCGRRTIGGRPGGTSNDDDCGCDVATVVSGRPSARARSVNTFEHLTTSTTTLYELSGRPTNLARLLSSSLSDSTDTGLPPPPPAVVVNLVVVLRSFGWPFCQESILQYATRREELRTAGVRLTVVSVGTPEVGRKLLDHLGIVDDDFVYADPDNGLYDDLDLNRGVATLMAPATAYRFRDRIFKEGNLAPLFQVLARWKDAVYLPPQPQQAFLQGGTFVLGQDRTVLAHYDESTGTHLSDARACAVALEEARRTTSLSAS